MLKHRKFLARLDSAVAGSRALDGLGLALSRLPAWATDGRLTKAVVTMTVRYIGHRRGWPGPLNVALTRATLAALPSDTMTTRWGDQAARWLASALADRGLTMWAARIRATNGLTA